MSDQERYIKILERENMTLRIKLDSVRRLLDDVRVLAKSDYVDTDMVMPGSRQHGMGEEIRIKSKDLLNRIYGIMSADSDPDPEEQAVVQHMIEEVLSNAE